MENMNENMVEQTQAVAKDIVENGSPSVKVIAGIVFGVTGIVVGGIALGRKVIKPMWDGHKAKKNGVTIEQGNEPELEAENVEVK